MPRTRTSNSVSQSVAQQLIAINRATEQIDELVFIEQIALLLYMKILDNEAALAADDTTEAAGSSQLFPGQAERYRWSSWRTMRFYGRDLLRFVRSEVLSYMASLVREDAQVADFFRDAKLMFENSRAFDDIVHVLDGLDLHRLGDDSTKDILEHLLSSVRSSPRIAEFRTPPPVRRLMVDLIDPTPDDTICDIACGTGGFLVDAVDHMVSDTLSPQDPTSSAQDLATTANYESLMRQLERSIFGYDISHRMTRIAIVNLILHGVRHPHIRWADSLQKVSSVDQQYSVVLSNPPFGQRAASRMASSSDAYMTRYGDVPFLSVMHDALVPGGRCAVIVPPSVLFQTRGAYLETRYRLIEEGEVLALIALPAGTFSPATSIAPHILVFRRPTDVPKRRIVWFYKVPSASRSGRAGRGSVLGEAEIQDLLTSWAEYRDSDFTVPPGVETGTVLDADSELRCWWAPIEAIAERSYSLAPDHYRPQVAPASRQDDPVALLRDLLDLERNIESGLEALLRYLETDG